MHLCFLWLCWLAIHDAKEWQRHSQVECLNHPHAPECLYGDIADFFRPSVRQAFESMQRDDQLSSNLLPLVEKNMAVRACLDCDYCRDSNCMSKQSRHQEKQTVVNHACMLCFRQAKCLVHGAECAVNRETAMIHVAGTPCTNISSMGLQDFSQALSFGHLLAWIGVRRVCQEPILIQENLDEFDRNLLTSLLPQYDFTFAVISPHQLSWPVRRVRQWAVLLGSST